MFKYTTLLFGVLFGLLDAVALPIVKAVSTGMTPAWRMVIPLVIYAVNPFIFLKALSTESMTIMNLVWDLSSDVIVTLIGVFGFGEHIPRTKMMGVLLSFVSLFLMTYEGNGWGGEKH
jgi:multidrug transporter EmrE-like cation transporter